MDIVERMTIIPAQRMIVDLRPTDIIGVRWYTRQNCICIVITAYFIQTSLFIVDDFKSHSSSFEENLKLRELATEVLNFSE